MLFVAGSKCLYEGVDHENCMDSPGLESENEGKNKPQVGSPTLVIIQGKNKYRPKAFSSTPRSRLQRGVNFQI